MCVSLCVCNLFSYFNPIYQIYSYICIKLLLISKVFTCTKLLNLFHMIMIKIVMPSNFLNMNVEYLGEQAIKDECMRKS